MIAALQGHLSYANVMATAAVFIALSGSSYAALKVTGADVRNGSLTKNDLRRNTLDGSRINESRLARVPRARCDSGRRQLRRGRAGRRARGPGRWRGLQPPRG